MRAVDLIHKKRNGGELDSAELSYIIEGYCNGDVPDYQMSAFAMAVFFRGMTARETAEMTLAMARSGDQIDLSPISGVKADKHSTGGVGDKTTLIIGPLVASCGVPVAKMSGRGLGHTGGTIDKLESIAGFQTELTREQFFAQVNEIGLAVIGQTGNITPADKKLYALRDVTATVESIPLIASSVMSKKIAAGADAIVLDVKTGSGAFMKSVDDAEALAKAMVEIGTEVGRQTSALISDMDQPLGYAIGNALEVREALDTLRGHGPADLTDLCIALSSHMVLHGGQAGSLEEAEVLLRDRLASGAALAKFREFVAAQGGDPNVVDKPELMPQAAAVIDVLAPADGFVQKIDAEELGLAAMLLGAGRATKEAAIDHAVGVVLKRKVGERVQAGEPIAVLHVKQDEQAATEVAQRVQQAYTIGAEAPVVSPLLLSVVTAEGVKRYV
ncbi:pyrimidine-nucleoside phosphorylase [Paenibacillus phyllosphaerae]|uniref:Pyrimidine-nucleoside phosphorylase n=1 Tax=Paenibacillus phyllosphaerae TaxID=274593 RepID=A0A7W5AV76_9BACL|nr:pyrimidine-nucleoside phosphorylase [Paenibacillus phyllosphaerae]MBB3109217.1 pyrimidine-nucleoside phosphorylase [Paenibacillus phyllosphaerae]